MGDFEIKSCKNMIKRLGNSLFSSEREPVHTFLLTKEDGSQKYVRATYCEFNSEEKEAHFYQNGQFVHGTVYTKVKDIEIVK